MTYSEIQQAIDAAVAAIATLPDWARINWLSYFFEAVEEDLGEQYIFEMRDTLLTRIENEMW